MEKLEAVKKLSAAVGSGSLANVSAADIYHAFGRHLQKRFWEAWHGSLDAARRLHDAVLPGWTYCDHLRRGLRYTSYIGKSVEDEPIHAVSDNPARAWIQAILKALISLEECGNEKS